MPPMLPALQQQAQRWLSRLATIDVALENRLAQRVVPHLEQHDGQVRHGCTRTVLRESKIIPGLRTRMIVAMVGLVCSDQLS